MNSYVKRICLYTVVSILTIAGISLAQNCTLYVQAADDAKIHYLTLPGNTEGILLECNGKFGMVDSGEDNDYPDGEDERYPYREGIIEGQGTEDRVIEYLKSLGVTTDNFEFYIGTHAHSDHIGSADEVIREFHPKRVYIQEYKDSYIRNSGRLWDNLYCYDNMIQAAKDVNASIILGFDNEAPLYPEKLTVTGRITLKKPEISDEMTEAEVNEENPEKLLIKLWNDEFNEEVEEKEITASSQSIDVEFVGAAKYAEDGHEISYSVTVEKDDEPLDCFVDISYSEDVTHEDNIGCDHFSLGGGMDIQICNYGDFYKSENAVNDANDFSLGVLVVANGKRVFLSGDINNSEDGRYAEARLLEELGHVDILTLGHHGASGSNGYSYVSGLSPEIMVLSGDYHYVSEMLDNDGYNLFETLQIMSEKGVPLYVTGWFENDMDAIVFSLGDQITSNIPKETRKIAYTKYCSGGIALCYHNGLQEKYNGWLNSNGYISYFDNSVYGLKTKKWMQDSNGDYHYFDGSGVCKVGWLLYGGKYYYLGPDIIMQTGWQSISGRDYYFYPTGELATGWQKKDDGNWLFYDSKGNVVIGWLKSAGYWYYLDENGYMLTGKQEINGEIYYLTSNGKMKTGWNEEDGVWFYYNSNGSMKKGWLKYNAGWYYLDKNGYMLTGKQEIDGETYYFTSSGKMKIGWNKEGTQWYYYGSSGAMCTNTWIDGKYYLKSDGTMAVSEWVDSERYYVDQNGCWVPGEIK